MLGALENDYEKAQQVIIQASLWPAVDISQVLFTSVH